MSSPLTLMRTYCRVAVLALALSAATFGASPVSAQNLEPNFSIGGGAAVQPETKSYGAQPNKGSRDFQLGCLSNREIRRGLREYGFSDISFVRQLRRSRVLVEALYEDDWYYSMRVNRCTGYVDRVTPLYPLYDDDDDDDYDD
jgi:hypothetical protein